MKLGDFFKAAPYARPVNPRPIEFTAITSSEVLPGGTPNPSRRPIAARIKGAFAFIGGDGALSARVETRKALADKYKGQAESGEFFVELTYQILWRVLHEWDEKEQAIGDKLFPDVDSLREMVEVPEADRVLSAYNKYVADEHPSDDKEGAPDASTFPGAKGSSS